MLCLKGRHEMANGKPQTTIIDRSQTTIICRSRVINIVRIIRIIKLTKAACANKHANESQKREQHFIGFSRFLEGGSTMPHRRIALPPVVVFYGSIMDAVSLPRHRPLRCHFHRCRTASPSPASFDPSPSDAAVSGMPTACHPRRLCPRRSSLSFPSSLFDHTPSCRPLPPP